MAGIGAAGAYAVNAASYVPFILVALWILPARARVTPLPADEVQPMDSRTLFAGVREVAREPALRNALLTVLVTSSMCVPLITFCPLLVKQVFQGEIGHFSLVIGAFGAGGLLGATALLAVDPGRDSRAISSAFALVFALLVALAALAPWFWALPVLFVLCGAAMTISNASANSLLQSVAPERIRGQSVSLYMLAMRGGVALGGLTTGVTISLLGVGRALLLNGVLALLAHFALRRAWLHPAKKT
jgi:predicted MFS family arabinose efflux permease